MNIFISSGYASTVQQDREEKYRIEHQAVIGGQSFYNPSEISKDGGLVRVECEFDGGEVLFRIADTGIGVSKEDLAHIGEEFFRAKNAHLQGIPGTGLGMSIVKQYVDRFNGKINIDSEEGKGSTFTIKLPFWRE